MIIKYQKYYLYKIFNFKINSGETILEIKNICKINL